MYIQVDEISLRHSTRYEQLQTAALSYIKAYKLIVRTRPTVLLSRRCRVSVGPTPASLRPTPRCASPESAPWLAGRPSCRLESGGPRTYWEPRHTSVLRCGTPAPIARNSQSILATARAHTAPRGKSLSWSPLPGPWASSAAYFSSLAGTMGSLRRTRCTVKPASGGAA